LRVIRTRDAAFIRKLCNLGLPPQTLAQTLLPALRQVIPAHSGGVFWVDVNGEMTGLYAERLLPPDAMSTYYERYYQTRTVGFADAFRSRAAMSDPVSYHSCSRAEQSTPYFQDVLARLDAYHVLYGILREDDAPFAQLSLYRGANDRPFDRNDAATMRELLRYLSVGLGRSALKPSADESSIMVEEELGVVLLDGSVVSAPQAWYRLLRLAALSKVSPSTARGDQQVIEQFVRDVCSEAFPRAATARKEVVRETPWGRFRLRGFLLADSRSRRSDQVGILIRREEPHSLSLIRGAGVSEMSPQQREVALLLARGKSNREIAQQLGLSLNTANYHVKQVFARLRVNDRAAVTDRLLRLAQAGTAS